MYKRLLRTAGLRFVILLFVIGTTSIFASAQESGVSRADFQDEMRRLWEDHIVWTRMYIISAIEELPDTDLVAQRLLRNQDEIGDAVKPFYGDEAGEALAELLREHILGAVELLQAAKAGDEEAATAASEAWSANADEIAAFLYAANPDNWTEEALAHEMHMHLELTLREAQARLAGDYEAEIAAYDEVHAHILRMADVLSEGIANQFPDQFTD